MINTSLFRLLLFFFGLSFMSLLHAATPDMTKNDPLQLYRDEIEQAEANASQAVLGQLKLGSEDHMGKGNNAYTRPSTNSESATPVLPRSNNDKALIPPPGDDLKENAAKPSSTQANPWLKPNPWGKVKKNPWANVPIPGPSSPPTASTHSSIPAAPPNIFAPTQQPSYKTPSNAKP